MGNLQSRTVKLSDGLGEARYPANLLAKGDTNTKLRKSAGQGFVTAGLSLSPHKVAGVGNVCPFASKGCMAACLDHQGMASVWKTIEQGRTNRTRLFYADRDYFLERLSVEIGNRKRTAGKSGQRLAVRLNVFSDISWEKVAPQLFSNHPDVQFYDYTKNPNRAGALLHNYWVTFSKSEQNQDDAMRILADAGNVAVVFADSQNNYAGNRSGLQQLPSSWRGYRVINGDESDLRFQDARGRKHGRIVGLKLKAHSRQERNQAIDSGFAVAWN